MPKKIFAPSLCSSLVLIFTLTPHLSLAAGIETEGDLKVHGVVESTSGGFKFPDGTTWTTGSMDGLLFNVGFVVDDSDSNTGNLTSGAIKFGSNASGEGIASQRTSGTGQNGLDFYTGSTSRLFIGNNGNVGIGTRGPLAKLHVLSSDLTQAAFGGTPIYLQNADGGATTVMGLNLYWDGGKYVYGSSHSASAILSGDSGLVFAVAPAGTGGGSPPGYMPKFVMRLTSDGKVRIGDPSSPVETLDVAGNGTITGSLVVDRGNANNGVVSTSALTFGLSSGEGVASKRTGGGNQFGLDFYSNFAPRMSITQGGNVGIGTDAPTTLLDVRGDTSVSGVVKAGPGQTGTPFAYGSFNANGVKISGSPNMSDCTWDTSATPARYSCPFSGYSENSYVTVVTPVNILGHPVFATTSRLSNILIVRLFDMSSATPTTPVQGPFHVVVFKP